MTAGAAVVCNEVTCKVEVVEKCDVNEVGVAATVDGNVGGGNGNGNVSCSIEVSAGDTGGVNVVDFLPKADSAAEVDRFKKEEVGVENEGGLAGRLLSETNGVVHWSEAVTDAEVKADKDDVNLENGSSVDPPVVMASNAIGQDADGHLDKSSVDVSGKTSEDLESQVTVDGSKSYGSPIQEQGGQPIVDGSSMPSEDLGIQVTADEPDSCGSSIKEREREVSVNGSDFAGSLVDNKECPVSVDDLEHRTNHTKKVESNTVVMKFDGEEHKELLVIMSEEQETLLKVSESVELEVNTEEIELVNVEDGFQGFQRVGIDSVESANGAEVSLEIETNTETVIHENTSSQIVVSDCIDRLIKSLQPEASAENVETTNTVESECNKRKLLVEKYIDPLSNPDDLVVVEQNIEIVSHPGSENRSAEGMDCGTEIETVDVSNDDDEKETAVEGVKDVPHLVTDIRYAESMDYGTGVGSGVFDDEEKEAEVKDADVEFEHHIVPENRSAEDMDCETGVKTGPVEEKESEVNDAPVGNHSTLIFSDTVMKSGAVIEFGSFGRHEKTSSIQNEEVEDMNDIQSDEIRESSVHGEVNDAVDVEIEEVENIKYNFLIKIPRFEDENIRDQIKSAQLLVDEKTRLRELMRAEVLDKRARLKAYNEEYNAAKREEIAARRLVRSKRQEIESVQAVINRLKNAISVEDIDSRILSVEHMIQHETIQLKDEKQFIREIRQLKSLRDQLALNMGTPEEIRQAIDQSEHNEERLMTFRKELDSLKAKVSKVEEVLLGIKEKYEDVSRKEMELQAKFRAADDERQKAYAHLNSLKKLSYDKNQNFRQFKADLANARKHASDGDKDKLHQLCADQVETFMEQWNDNDEFRKDYVSRLNMIASKRQKALEGGPPGPGDVMPLLPSNVNEGVDWSAVSISDEVKHVSMVLPVKQGKDVSSTENKKADNNHTSQSIENVQGQKNQNLINKGVTNSGSDYNLGKEEAEVAENIATKEETELARKAEELRKEENAAKLKEQLRLEEKAKAIEALERKKRNAEKAQLKAELWARKEAEQKEKEREKRLRKKEKKKTGGGDGNINGEEAASPESSNGATTRETETINKKKTQKPPAHFFTKQSKPKPVPPQLLNKNKKRWQFWGNMAVTGLALIFLFVLINSGVLFEFKYAKFNIPL